jgi:probable F420-dependent oxidoreductase
VWFPTGGLGASEAAELAGLVEDLGYSALWVAEHTGRDPFAHVAFLATATTELVFATGVASIFHRHPGVMAQAANTLAEQTGGRFVLGIGVSHGPIVTGMRGLEWSKPVETMASYLDSMDAARYDARAPAEPPLRLLAALGPRMLALAAARTDGAHPYWTTPDHTAAARETLGPDKLLCVEQKIVLSTDAEAARRTAAASAALYAPFPNYRNSWKRQGFSDEEIDEPSTRFIDGVVAWGDEAAVRRRVREHYDAGASHVCIQPLDPERPGRVTRAPLEALAPALRELA